MPDVRHYFVRDEHGDYGEFFVRESVSAHHDGTPRYSATWVCYSSFGVFGHHWYSMSRPLAEFAAGAGHDYVLGKIGHKRTSAERTIKSVKRAVLTARRENRIGADVAREAMDAIDEVEQCGDDVAVPHLLYESTELSRVHIEWCDLETQEWEPSAVMFMRRLWPLFVKELAGAILVGGVPEEGE